MNELIQELESPSINLLSIRKICQSNPGLLNVSRTSGAQNIPVNGTTQQKFSSESNSHVNGPQVSDAHSLRVRVWTLLLLGPQYSTKGRVLQRTKLLCDEHAVLLADIKRTRQDMPSFRTSEYSNALCEILNCFCVEHSIQYKQGMNEVCSVFVHFIPPCSEEAIVWTYDLFSAFMYRFMERYCCLDSITYLQKSFQLFQVLLQYHDPVLGTHLADGDMAPDVYTPEWFLTLFSRSVASLDLLSYLWDALVCGGDPVLVYFLGYAMLQIERPGGDNGGGNSQGGVWSRREELLDCDGPQLVESMSGKQLGGAIASTADVELLVSIAQAACDLTPRCFVRCLRLSCVASATAAGDVRSTFTGGSKNGTGTSELVATDVDDVGGGGAGLVRPAPPAPIVTVSASAVPSSTAGAGAGSDSVPVVRATPASPSAKGRSRPDGHQVKRAFEQNYLSRQDESMSRQSFLDFVSMEPRELVAYILESGVDEAASGAATSGAGGNAHALSRQQHVVIDLRAAEDVTASGGVTLPMALQLDPACLAFLDDMKEENVFVSNNPTSSLLDEDEDEDGGGVSSSSSGGSNSSKVDSSNFYRWLQHYDGMKGCHICIVDTPLPPAATLAAIAALGLQGVAADATSLTASIASQLASYDYNQLLSSAARASKAGVDFWAGKHVAGAVAGALSSAQAGVAAATGTVPDAPPSPGEFPDVTAACPESGAMVRTPVKEEAETNMESESVISATSPPTTPQQQQLASLSLSSYWSSIRGLGTQISSIVAPVVISSIPSEITSEHCMRRRIAHNADYLHKKVASSRQFSKASIALAKALQRHGFKYVSVLDGGVPALLQQCYSRKGTVEPLLVNFDYGIWEKYLKDRQLQQFSCDRQLAGASSVALAAVTAEIESKTASPSNWGKVRLHDPGAINPLVSEGETEAEVPTVYDVPIVIRYSAQLTAIERVRLGLDYATRHNHTGMMAQLSVRLKRLQDEVDG